jgi:hypothetical protein
MPTALWKMDHPCFFDFFCSDHAGDGFRLHSGFFYLYRFADIFFELYSDSFFFQLTGMGHCSRFAL